MIARNITKSKKIAQLTDTQRVIYAFILPFLDREGRINAHPTYLKGHVFLSLEYDEATIEAAVRRFHDVGLATVYATEDAVVVQYTAFEEFNKPNHREVASEYPAPSDELLNRVETSPTTTRKAPPPVNAQETTRQVPGVYRAEVEVEVEREVEVEVEKSLPGLLIPKPPPPQPRSATATTAGENRVQSFNLIKAKLGTRHTNHAEGDPPIDLLTECLSEDPSRDSWFELPPARVRALIQKAGQEKNRNRFGTFKGFLIELLDKETGTDTVKPKAATPPVAGAPPGVDSGERFLRESMGDAMYEELYGKA